MNRLQLRREDSNEADNARLTSVLRPQRENLEAHQAENVSVFSDKGQDTVIMLSRAQVEAVFPQIQP